MPRLPSPDEVRRAGRRAGEVHGQYAKGKYKTSQAITEKTNTVRSKNVVNLA